MVEFSDKMTGSAPLKYHLDGISFKLFHYFHKLFNTK